MPNPTAPTRNLCTYAIRRASDSSFKGMLRGVMEAPDGTTPKLGGKLNAGMSQLELSLDHFPTELADFDLVEVRYPDGTVAGRWKHMGQATRDSPTAVKYTLKLSPLASEMTDPAFLGNYTSDATITATGGTPLAALSPTRFATIINAALPHTRHCFAGTVNDDGVAYTVAYREHSSRPQTVLGQATQMMNTYLLGGDPTKPVGYWWFCDGMGSTDVRNDPPNTHTITRFREIPTLELDQDTLDIYNTIVVEGGTPAGASFPIVIAVSDTDPTHPFSTVNIGIRQPPGNVIDTTLLDVTSVTARANGLLAAMGQPSKTWKIRVGPWPDGKPRFRSGDWVYLRIADPDPTQRSLTKVGPFLITESIEYGATREYDLTLSSQLTLNPLAGRQNSTSTMANWFPWDGGGITVPLPGGLGGSGSCCGGEVLMAEAFTDDTALVTGTAAATLVTIPITVDTANTRIRVAANVWLTEVGAGGKLVLTGPDGTVRTVRYTGVTSGEEWDGYSWEVPALSVIAPGAYNVTLAITCAAGPPSPSWTLGYQVLVSLVTSG